jgi:hypothetical protein
MVPLLLITKTPGRPSQVFGPANICAIVEYLKYDVYASGGTRDLSRRLALMTPARSARTNCGCGAVDPADTGGFGGSSRRCWYATSSTRPDVDHDLTN